MFFRILKKELKKKKGVNFILFLFILLATVFVASSVNNILVVKNATKYCMDKGQVPDDCVWVDDGDSVTKMDQWLKNEGKKKYDSYEKNEMISLVIKNIQSYRGEKGKNYNILDSIVLQEQWEKNMIVYDEKEQKAEIKDGTIAMQQEEMDRNKLNPGDEFTLVFGTYKKTFHVANAIKDPSFGGDFIGETRYFISHHDYQEVRQHRRICERNCTIFYRRCDGDSSEKR